MYLFSSNFICGGNTRMAVNPLDVNPTININMSEPFQDTKEWSWETTTPFIAPVKSGKCIKCYDGDTITIASRLPFTKELAGTVFRFSVRLYGIDCPEIRGKTVIEKAKALVARDELKKKILDKHVILRNVMTEKYGRLLADVYVVENGKEVWVNKWMLDEKHAVWYDGQTKKIPEDWV